MYGRFSAQIFNDITDFTTIAETFLKLMNEN